MFVKILGVEALTYKTAIPQASLLINHIKAVRSIPGLEASYAVLVVEANLGNEAMHHQMYISQHRLANVIIMHEDTQDRAGLRTTHDSKRTMVVQLNEAIRNSNIHFFKRMVSINGKRDAAAMKRELINQIANFKRVVEPPTKPHQEPKERYTGKSGGGRDDLVMSLMQSLYAKALFYSRPEKYQKYFDSDNDIAVL